LSYGYWNISKNNYNYHDDDSISYTEVTNEDANILTKPEDATIDETQAKKHNKVLK
jgi:hypothetical protein